MQYLKSKYVQLLLLCVLFVFINEKTSRSFHKDGFSHVLLSDARGYYNYLPYTFIYKDVLHQDFAWELPNGYMQNKYTCGVSILQSPFFFLARAVVPFTGYRVDDPYSHLYGFFMVVAVNVYLFIGFVLLFFLLRERFGVAISLLSMALLMWGTNLYYYTVVEAGMSHVYSFFCFAAFLFCTDRYYRTEKTKWVPGVAFFYALATLIRPTNGLLILMFVFHEVYDWEGLKARLRFHLQHLQNVLYFFVIGFLVFSPQLFYWHAISGHWIMYSYGDEAFIYLKEPKLFTVLMGYKSGWLFYSPVMVLAVVGMVMARKQRLFSMPVFIGIFLTIFYLCASWWAYTFGCAFGYRSFVEFYAILIFPFALCIQYILKNASALKVVLLFVFFLLCVHYNLRLSDHYVAMGGCWDGPEWTWEKQAEMMKQALHL